MILDQSIILANLAVALLAVTAVICVPGFRPAQTPTDGLALPDPGL